MLFYELIRIALEQKGSLSKEPSYYEWKRMFEQSQKQAVAGIAFLALERLAQAGQKPPLPLLYEWIGVSERIKAQNRLLNKRCIEITKLFEEAGFRSCILKGQGTALHYDNPEYRQSGDIDIWVEGDRDDLLAFAKKKGVPIRQVDIKHSDMDFFREVPVEVHFIPSWMYCPFKNRRLQAFFSKYADRQFANKDTEAGFAHTTIDFDLIYSLVHIYRHVFEEGIGFRQLLDYYYILTRSTKEQRYDAFEIIKSIGLVSFSGGVMYVLKECFDLDEERFLCNVNKRHGKHLLSEILTAGNFGHFDTRYAFKSKDRRFQNGMVQLRRNLRNLPYYPSEVVWSPFWKIWHWCWRKSKGYL